MLVRPRDGRALKERIAYLVGVFTQPCVVVIEVLDKVVNELLVHGVPLKGQSDCVRLGSSGVPVDKCLLSVTAPPLPPSLPRSHPRSRSA